MSFVYSNNITKTAIIIKIHREGGEKIPPQEVQNPH